MEIQTRICINKSYFLKKLLFILFLNFGSYQSSLADHGPFSIKNQSEIHELHLGIVLTTNFTGEPKRFGIRACTTTELDFVNPWRSAQKGTIPFKVKTQDIVAFGLAGTISSRFNNGNAVGSLGSRAIGAITNPISLPLSIFSKGTRDTFQYSIFTINNENGRIAQRGIILYSQKDVNYLNDYLKKSTGYNPSEQLTNEELEKKYIFLKNKVNIKKPINCNYMKKYGQSVTKREKSKNKSTKFDCDSPVWKKRPQCN